jgi:hypothetical protein
MAYKMLCSDLDGTLLGLKNRATPFCCQVFKKYASEIDMVLVSARMPSGMRYIQKELGISNKPMVCYNGALVMDGEKVLSATYIELVLVKQLLEICVKNSVAIGLYAYDEWRAAINSERIAKEEFNTQTKVVFEPTLKTIERWAKKGHGAHKLMLMGSKESLDVVFKILERQMSGLIGIYRSNDSLIEISPASIDKLGGIEKLLRPGIGLEHIIAFGDNFNDISMLSAVGLGIAVENARPAVKAVAKELVAKCTEDGVAHFLEAYFTQLKNSK